MTETNKHRLEAERREKDVRYFASGGMPTDDEIAAAPRLESWVAMLRVDDRDERFMSIHGSVDGSPLRTSPVVWFDRHNRFVRTRNRLYALGEPAGDAVKGDA